MLTVYLCKFFWANKQINNKKHVVGTKAYRILFALPVCYVNYGDL